ncbi:MAG: hypothetical protein ACKN87_23835, partial [Microcystis aeruginosa]
VISKPDRFGERKHCAPTVTDFVHNVGANCVRPKGTLSKQLSVISYQLSVISLLANCVRPKGLLSKRKSLRYDIQLFILPCLS